MEDWQESILEEIEREILKDDSIVNFFEAVRFQSRSKGKRHKRKSPKTVILIRPRGTRKWFSWDGENDFSLPWDTWATEALGFFQAQTKEWPGDFLRSRVISLLDRLGKL
jgi:hypothetical protein